MKKHLLILFVAMFAAAWSLNAQTIVINEGFENGIQDEERAIKRDNITKNDFDLREKASINYDKKRFDFVICDINKDVIDRLVNYI